jgi:hypothetical protein
VGGRRAEHHRSIGVDDDGLRIVALSAVNSGLVMRREREAWWSAPIFPYLGWMILWVLTWAAVELNMLQRLLDTVSLTGARWVLVIALSLVAPAFNAIDRARLTPRITPKPTTRWSAAKRPRPRLRVSRSRGAFGRRRMAERRHTCRACEL